MSRCFSWIVLPVALAVALSACSKQTAEEKGKELATEKIDLVKGVGEALKDKGGQAAESVAHGTGEVLQGMEKGFSNAFDWKLTNGPGMTAAGLAISRVQPASSSVGAGNKVDTYVTAARDSEGALLMIAYDARKREMARARINLKIAAGEGRYETFVLDERTPVKSIREVSFELLPAAPSDPVKK
jgi:hypothetical protein